MADGRALENLVRHIESLSLPDGVTVAPRHRVLDDDGLCIAELDIRVTGRIGTVDFEWLFECRDRPSDGAQGAGWIEQLIGRRRRFNLSRVVAVSTTGFAQPAIKLATEEGIELRSVETLTPQAFQSWLQLASLTLIENKVRCRRVHFVLHSTLPDDERAAAEREVAVIRTDDASIRSRGENYWTPSSLMLLAMEQHMGADCRLFEPGLLTVAFVAQFRDEDEVEKLVLGEWRRLRAIRFEGEIDSIATSVPLADAREYRRALTGEILSQSVTSESVAVRGKQLCLELHHLGDGSTHLAARQLAIEDSMTKSRAEMEPSKIARRRSKTSSVASS